MFKNILTTTKRDGSHFLKNGSWIVLANVLNTCLVFVLSIFYANYLSPETYGNYKYILSFIGLFSMFTLGGVDLSIYIHQAKNIPINIRSLISKKIKYGLIGSFAALATGTYFAINGNWVFALPFFFSFWLIPITDTFGIYTELWRSKTNFKKPAFFSVFISIINTVFLIFLITQNSPLWLLISLPILTTTVLNFLVYKKAYKNTIGENVIFSEEETKEAFKHGKHFTAIKIISNVSGYIQTVLIFKILGNSALAIFFFMIAPIEQIRGIGGGFIDSLFPKIATTDWKNYNLKKIILRLSNGFIFSWLIVFVYLIIAKPFFNLFFPVYAPYVYISMLMSASLPFSFVNMTLQSVMRNHVSIKNQYYFGIIDTIIFIIVISLFGFYFGLVGLAYGILTYKIIQLALLLFINTPRKKIVINKFFDIQRF
jgi:O-antigen/teichoic acid export membrane protein